MDEIKQPRLIAEVGCNHGGNEKTAKEMIEIAAKFSNADIVKFQKRTNKELLSEQQYNAPHPVPKNSFGTSYGEHREFLELTVEQHRKLKEHCEKNNVVYSSSVWDLTAAKEIESIKPNIIKIPSACNTNDLLVEWICENFSGEIHISMGMTKRKEEEGLIRTLDKTGRMKDVVLYACTSGYPVKFQDACILEINRLRENYGSSVSEIAFSGHHLGIAIDIAAYTLGATTIERHFTLDRTSKGTDHAASLEPGAFRKLKRDLLAAFAAMTYKDDEILDIEKEQREKLKFNNTK